MTLSPQPFFNNIYAFQTMEPHNLSGNSSPSTTISRTSSFSDSQTHLQRQQSNSAHLIQAYTNGQNRHLIAKPTIEAPSKTPSPSNLSRNNSANYEQEVLHFNEAFTSDFIDFLNSSPMQNYSTLCGKPIQTENLIQTQPISQAEDLEDLPSEAAAMKLNRKISKKSSKAENKETKQKVQAKKEGFQQIPEAQDLESTFPKYYINYFYKLLEGSCHPKLQNAFGNLDMERKNRFVNFMRIAHKCRTWAEFRTYIEIDAYLELVTKKGLAIRESLVSFIESFESIPSFEQLMGFLARFNITGEVIAQYFVHNQEADGHIRKILSSLLFEVVATKEVNDHWLDITVLARPNSAAIVSLARDAQRQMGVCKEFQRIVMGKL